MADLSDEEIDELHRLYAGLGVLTIDGPDGNVTVTATGDLSDAMLRAFAFGPRMLDEIERRRMQEMLDAPETAEEKAALDSIPSEPERIIARSRERLLRYSAGRPK